MSFFTGWIDVLPVKIASMQVDGVEYNAALSTTHRLRPQERL